MSGINTIWLYNPTEEYLEYLFNGDPYGFQPGEVKAVIEDAGLHLLHHLEVRGLVRVSSPEEVIRNKIVREMAAAEKKEAESIEICEYCGKEFSGERADFRLKQHKPHCHNNPDRKEVEKDA